MAMTMMLVTMAHYHMAVQSKWTISHLLGLKAIESANSIPCNVSIIILTTMDNQDKYQQDNEEYKDFRKKQN